MDHNEKRPNWLCRNKTPLVVLALIYVGIGYVLHFATIKNEVHIVKKDANQVIIQIVKKP